MEVDMKIIGRSCDVRKTVQDCYELAYWLRDVIVNSMSQSRGMIVVVDESHPLTAGQKRLGLLLTALSGTREQKIIREEIEPSSLRAFREKYLKIVEAWQRG